MPGDVESVIWTDGARRDWYYNTFTPSQRARHRAIRYIRNAHYYGPSIGSTARAVIGAGLMSRAKRVVGGAIRRATDEFAVPFPVVAEPVTDLFHGQNMPDQVVPQLGLNEVAAVSASIKRKRTMQGGHRPKKRLRRTFRAIRPRRKMTYGTKRYVRYRRAPRRYRRYRRRYY